MGIVSILVNIEIYAHKITTKKKLTKATCLITAITLQNPFDHSQTLFLDLSPDRLNDLLCVWGKDTRGVDYTVQDELDGNTAGDTNSDGHGAVAIWFAISL